MQQRQWNEKYEGIKKMASSHLIRITKRNNLKEWDKKDNNIQIYNSWYFKQLFKDKSQISEKSEFQAG
jgi:hypothetical protein